MRSQYPLHWTGSLLAVVGLLVVAGPTDAANRYVATTGSDTGNDCAVAGAPCATVRHAVGQASSGDTIAVATGRYTETVRIDSSTVLTFLGGWDATFATRSPLTQPSVIKAGVAAPPDHGRDRIFGVYAAGAETIDVTIDGFLLTKGQGRSALPGIEVPGIGTLLAEVRGGGALAALALEDSTVTLNVRNTTFTRNKDTYGGAAMFLASQEDSSLDATLEGVRIERNVSRGESAGIWAYALAYEGGAPASLSLQLRNCVITRNTARSRRTAGGALNTGSTASSGSVTVDVTATSITRNLLVTAKPEPQWPHRDGGAGVSVYSPWLASQVTLRDTVVWGNKLRGAVEGRDVFEKRHQFQTTSPLVLDVDHTDIGDLLILGTLDDLGGNLSVDPLLDRRTTHLLAGSPLIDTGTCVGAPATDAEGDPRPTGSGCDIGADEFVP